MALKQAAWVPPAGCVARVVGRLARQDPLAERCAGTVFTLTHLRQQVPWRHWGFHLLEQAMKDVVRGSSHF